MKTLVLASGSSSRKEILEEADIHFVIDVSNYEEDMSVKLPPRELAIYLSKGKAREVSKRHKKAVILAADSFGVFNNKLLGKPHTLERAKEMLQLLSGQCHSFITGFTLIDSGNGKEYSGAVETKVYFKTLTNKTIDNYIAKEDVLEKAGAYTIQGLGKQLISKIEGDYNNVRGLPLSEVIKALKTFGIVYNL